MAAFDTDHPHRGAAAGRFGRLFAVIAAWQSARADRATRAALLRLNDHELNDIGLTRGDVLAWGHRSN